MMFTYKIEKRHDGILLRDYLRDELSLSTRLIKKAKSPDGQLLINGAKKTVRYPLRAGDTLQITFPKEERSASLRPENIPLHIMYEDEHILVINKPSGMATIPSQLHPSGTMANGILFYYDIKKLPYTIHIVTRLDKDTSGLVVVAKHQYSHSLLTTLQRNNELIREYEAIVSGRLDKKFGTIDAPIGRKQDSIIERTVTSSGKRAVTHYRVVKEMSNFSLVRIRLETGRTHQIRVHFAHIGYPLIGDRLYGKDKQYMTLLQRQALHCRSVRFVHPFTKKTIEVSCPLPDDVKAVLQ